MTTTDRLVVIGAAAYLLVTGWAMANLSYDVWGAFIVAPVIMLVSVPLIRRAFRDDLVQLVPFAIAGLVVKLSGSVAGYYLRFDAYGGSADAGRYHNVGKVLAGDVRAGLTSPLAVMPSGQGTPFIEELTGLIYTFAGSSRMGGFMVFTWFSFWGLAFFVKAASTAIPGLAQRRYAGLVFFFPSLVYWGSSIGKEAVVGFFLGVSAYGAARLLTDTGRRSTGVLLAGVGIAGAGYVRPHFAAIWAGALLIAFVVKIVRDLVIARTDARRGRAATVALAVFAAIGFVVVATITLDFLPSPAEDDLAVTDRISSIFDEVERRTDRGGSSFGVATISGPQDWPYAAARTLTRPLLIEARSLAELLPALEMTFLLALGLFSWRRLANVPLLLLRNPYLVFALLALAAFGVAFASVGNLGILVRQRSLVLPLLLLLWCVPPLPVAERPNVVRPGDDAVRARSGAGAGAGAGFGAGFGEGAGPEFRGGS